jgi:hypothetical protein
VIDDATGRRQMLHFTAGCRPNQLGSGRILLLCRDSASARTAEELYDIASGQTTTFVPNPALMQAPLGVPCSDPTDCGVQIAGIGSDWVSLNTGQFDEHTWPTYAFQNLTTGQGIGPPLRRDDIGRSGPTEPVMEGVRAAEGTSPHRRLRQPCGGAAHAARPRLGDRFRL